MSYAAAAYSVSRTRVDELQRIGAEQRRAAELRPASIRRRAIVRFAGGHVRSPLQMIFAAPAGHES